MTLRKPEAISKAAAQVTAENIEEFLATIMKYIDDKGLTEFLSQHPENIINMDESAFELNSHPSRVMTDKSIPHTLDREVAGHHKNITVTVTIGADGTMWPPQVIFKEGFKKVGDVSFSAGCKFNFG